jgi:hypothetical protein
MVPAPVVIDGPAGTVAGGGVTTTGGAGTYDSVEDNVYALPDASFQFVGLIGTAVGPVTFAGAASFFGAGANVLAVIALYFAVKSLLLVLVHPVVSKIATALAMIIMLRMVPPIVGIAACAHSAL